MAPLASPPLHNTCITSPSDVTGVTHSSALCLVFRDHFFFGGGEGGRNGFRSICSARLQNSDNDIMSSRDNDHDGSNTSSFTTVSCCITSSNFLNNPLRQKSAKDKRSRRVCTLETSTLP